MSKPQRKMIFALAAVLLLVAAGFTQAQEEKDCLSYEPTVVKLKGRIARKTFPGPPNYESVKNGDRPETYWFLELDYAVCVDADKKSPDLNPVQQGIRRLQLVFEDHAEYDRYKGFVGKKVIATGTLFGSHTGHHHANVLLRLKDMEKAR